MYSHYGFHSWSKSYREEALIEIGRARRKEKTMTEESKFTLGKGTRIVLLTLALLMAMTAGLAFRALPAEAACYNPYGCYPTIPCPINWTGSNLSESKTGTPCNDTLKGLGGDDQLYGKEGFDSLNGGTGNDFIDGGPNSTASGYDESIVGGPGGDTLYGGGGNETISADDTVYGQGHAKDTVNAGDGDDSISLYSDGYVDVVDGGPGNDTVWYWCTTREAIDQLQNIENVKTACIG
jgi:hypothetical protein